MLQAGLIFTGLSLDSFIVMMQKGAQIKDLTTAKMVLYALMYAFISIGALLAGYGCSIALDGFLPDGKFQITFGGMLMFAVGVMIVTKTFQRTPFLEKIDRTFNALSMAKLAVLTCIDTLFIGTGFSMLGMDLVHMIPLCFAISFATVLAGLWTGYTQGAAYQKVFGVSGGVLMVIFSVYITVKYVLR